MKYFTADLHLGHQLVAELRGYDSVQEHDEAVLAPLRTLDPRGDQLWILGDLSGGSKGATLRALEALDGNVDVPMHLVAGNHCPVHPMHRDAHKWLRRYLEVFESVQPFARHRIDGRSVLLSHFPYQGGGDHTAGERYTQYRLPDLGEPLLHGHTHATSWLSGDRSVCVSLDAWAMQPVTETAIAACLAFQVAGS